MKIPQWASYLLASAAVCLLTLSVVSIPTASVLADEGTPGTGHSCGTPCDPNNDCNYTPLPCAGKSDYCKAGGAGCEICACFYDPIVITTCLCSASAP